MKKGKVATAVAGLAALLTLTAACGSSSSATSEGSISIGLIIDKTGIFASNGIPALNGVKLAVDEINQAGGINGRTVNLRIKDDTSNPSVAAATAHSMRRKVQVVLGTASGQGCRAVQPILDAAKVFQYCLSPQQFSLRPLFFWGLAPVTSYAPATLPWLKAKGFHRIAFIGQNDAAAQGYLSLFKYFAKSDPANFQIVAQENFDSGATDVEAQMTKIREAAPDLIVAGTSGGNIVPIVRAVKSLGMTQPIWVGTGSASLDALNPLASDLPAGGLFANAFWADIADQVPSTVPYAGKVTSFGKAYSAKYGQQSVSAAAGAYDATMQVVDALRSGAKTGQQVASYLEANTFTGVLGNYKFSPTVHQGASLPPVMMTYKGKEGFKVAFSGP
jgi:branched-chain amino acid transport system substrate-binding protein